MTSCMEITWIYVASRRKTKGQCWDPFLKYVVSPGMTKVMVLNGEEGLEYEVRVNGM